jgi:putative addiction module killer protein
VSKGWYRQAVDRGKREFLRVAVVGESDADHVVTYVLPSSVAFRVEEYVREDGSIPFTAWFDQLDHQAAAKVATAVARLSAGNTSSIKWFSSIGEIRIDWGPGYRVYLAKDGEALIILFCGGTKKRQHADIIAALALHAEYKARKQAAAKKAR